VQTDPVIVLDGAGSAPASQNVMGMPTAPLGDLSTTGWTAADEAAQAEALRSITLLAETTSHSRLNENRVAELEAEVRAERASRQEVDSQLVHERNRKEAVQQQVLCLEYELDGKEASLQVAERTLEQRAAELQRLQQQLQDVQSLGSFGQPGSLAFSAGAPTAPLGSQPGSLAFSVAAPGDDARARAMRAQLVERDRQLELKDQHISRLLNVLRTSRGGYPGEEDFNR